MRLRNYEDFFMFAPTRFVSATLVFFIGAMIAMPSTAQSRIDLVRPDAPELTEHGSYPVGVKTVDMLAPGRIDVLNVTDTDIPIYGRPLRVEIWYPAAGDTVPGEVYQTNLRDGITQTEISGMAARDAEALSGESFPVVIVSHGYPGNRLLMSHFGENLASKGYVVASIDHTDSTYADRATFGSTLFNRPLDQRFVLDQMGDASVIGTDLYAIADTSNSAVIGYSMGGYGALIYAGAGVTEASVDYSWSTPRGLLAQNQAGSVSHADLTDDPRLKAVIAIGPWGRNAGFWDGDGLSGISRPLMVMAGSVDDTSKYPALRQIFEESTGVTRHLLTFLNAGHNAAAPMPAPFNSWEFSEEIGFAPFEHYADPVWDSVKMNNIAQHFATAFLDLHLKGDASKVDYLDLVEDPGNAVFATEEDGTFKDEHTYWSGFSKGAAAGLTFETLEPDN